MTVPDDPLESPWDLPSAPVPVGTPSDAGPSPDDGAVPYDVAPDGSRPGARPSRRPPPRGPRGTTRGPRHPWRIATSQQSRIQGSAFSRAVSIVFCSSAVISDFTFAGFRLSSV